MSIEWKCAGCGVISKDRVRRCECATNVLFNFDGKKMTHESKLPTEQDRRDAAFDALEKMAREINPKLPKDLSGHEIRISLSKDHQSATAVKV